MIKFIGATFEDTATIEECVAYCEKQKVLGLDIETSRKYPKNQYQSKVYKPGLDPYLSRVVMLQIGTEELTFVIDTRRVSIEKLKPILESEDTLKVGHNLGFEYRHLLVSFGVRLRNIWDTMIVELILTNGLKMGYGLADLSVRYFGAKKVENMDLFNMDDFDERKGDFDEWIYDQEATIYLDKSTRLGFIEIGDRPFTKKQIEYGADDVILPLRIREKQLEGAFNYQTTEFDRYRVMAEGWMPYVCIDLENRFTLTLAEMEVKGMHFNPSVWMKTYEEQLPVYYERRDKLDKYIVDNFPEFTGPGDMFTEEGTCAIKWTSQKQVVSFFRHRDICPKERSKSTGRMEWTVGAVSVFKQLTKENKQRYRKGQDVEIVDEQTFMLQYLLFKKSEQLITTFGKDWLKNVHPITKRIHSSFRQILNTGRMSSTRPNLQQIPGRDEYRSAFIAPLGFKVVNTDYSAQEVRVLAFVSGVQSMKDFFILGDPTWGDDFHSYTATRVQRILKNNKDYIVPPKELEDGSDNPEFTKDHNKERGDAKSITFKLAYGGSPFSLKDELGITIEEAEYFFQVYFDAFPGLEENFKITKEKALSLGYIEIDPITERRWWCPFLDEMEEANEKAWSYYPDNYKDLDRQEKKEFKDRLYAKHPEVQDLWRTYFSLKGKLERAALNYRIQGLASGMTKRAAVRIYERLRDAEFLDKVWLNNLVHDETNAIAVEQNAQHCAKLVKFEMESAGEYFCQGMPMTAKPAIVDFWKH